MSKKTDRQKERNQQYWKDRAERNILSAEKNADELLKIMKHSYNEANKLIREEIQNFYGRFTWKQGITYEETLQRLNRKELKLFQEQAKKYYDEAYAENWQTAYTDRMRTLSARAYMSRLEELKVNIYHQYQKIAEELNVQLGEGLSKQYESSFEDMMYNLAHTTGIGVQIPKINDAIVEKTIKEKWLGGNYSSRVWQNKDKLVDVLNKDLPVMFTLGKHPNVIAEHLSGKLENNFKLTYTPARHFSGRDLNQNKTLWTSYMLQTPKRTIWISGDSGYGPHFAKIGEKFKDIDLGIMENGQYNEDWALIHTLPQYLGTEMKEINAKRYLTVHHSKFALSKHDYDEPLKNAAKAAQETGKPVLMPQIGEVIYLD